MTITLSYSDYWELFEVTSVQQDTHAPDSSDITWGYPEPLGQGYRREIQLREGLELAIAHYQLQDAVTLYLPEREHPLEYSFYLAGGYRDQQSVTRAGQYCLCGSGLAPAEVTEWVGTEQFEITVHLDPKLFTTWLAPHADSAPVELQSLVQLPPTPYYVRAGHTTDTMQAILQQILQCPFHGITRRLYLESKVWELMALLVAQELEQRSDYVPIHRSQSHRLKADDIDRIHQAKTILLQRLNDPPSLIELARQVGLNDCTLKRGFRQVFGQTAFGLLHDYRLEQAQHLLREGQLNVSEVAHAIGFANRSYFAAAFRKKFGVSPKEYSTRRVG